MYMFQQLHNNYCVKLFEPTYMYNINTVMHLRPTILLATIMCTYLIAFNFVYFVCACTRTVHDMYCRCTSHYVCRLGED